MELWAIIDSLRLFKAQLRGTKFTILTDQNLLGTFMDRTPESQELRCKQVFLPIFDQPNIYIASKENFNADAISRNYLRIGTSNAEQYFIPDSIDNSTQHWTPTLPIPTDTITCNHLFIPSLIPDMLEYAFSTRCFSHTDCECILCSSRGQIGGHYHTCPKQGDNDWLQFVTYPVNTEFLAITPPAQL